MKQQLSKINQKAFSLIELSIVILIISIFMASFLNMVGSINKRDKYAETREKLEKIDKAIKIYYDKNGILPEPALINIPVTDAGYGVGATLAGVNLTSTQFYASNIFYGMIPFADLGLSEQDVYDAWGNRISYFLHEHRLNKSDRGQKSFPSIQITFDANRSTTWQTRGSQACLNAQQMCPGGGGGDYAALYPMWASYVLVSHGQDGYLAFNANGLQNGIDFNQSYQFFGANTQQQSNSFYFSSISGQFYDMPINTNRRSGTNQDYFDDIVKYENATDLGYVYLPPLTPIKIATSSNFTCAPRCNVGYIYVGPYPLMCYSSAINGGTITINFYPMLYYNDIVSGMTIYDPGNGCVVGNISVTDGFLPD